MMATLRQRREDAVTRLLARRAGHELNKVRLQHAVRDMASSPRALAGAALAGFIVQRGRSSGRGFGSGAKRTLAKALVLARTLQALRAWLR